MSRSSTDPVRLRLALGLCAAFGLVMPVFAAAPVKERDATGLTARVERLEGLMQNQGLMDLLQQVQALQQEVNRLRGEIDVQANTLEQMRERERALHADMDRRLQALESGATTAPGADAEPAAGTETSGEPPLQQMSGVPAEDDVPAGPEADTPLTVETVGAPAPAAAAEEPSAPAPAGGTTDQADYERAFWLLKQARYDDAIKAFRDYRAAWPKGRYADSAQYWLGEGYHATRNYEQALIEYERLIAGFPDSQKLTHALLKSGYCLQELGRHDEARTRLNDLVSGYPGTTAARLAEERLRAMTASARTP